MTDNTNEVPRWDRFWFEPCEHHVLHRVRLVAAVAATVWFASWLGRAGEWLAPDGVVAASTVSELSSTWVGRQLVGSHPYHLLPWLGLASSLLWATGKFAWPAGATVLACALAIIHRAPQVMGPAEAVLPMLVFYWLLAGRSTTGLGSNAIALEPGLVGGPASTGANIVTRLIQLHLIGLLLVTGLQQLGGSDVWWNGEAAWWLIAGEHQRVLDLTWLYPYPLALNAATHYGAAYPLLAATLALTPLSRYVVWGGVPYWVAMGILTGDLFYSAMMLAALMAVFAPSWGDKR